MAQSEKHIFTTGVGRLIRGSLSQASDIGYDNKKRDKPQFYFAVAFPKNDQTTMNVINGLMQFAWTKYQAVPAVSAAIQQGLASPGFSWKITDGDQKDWEGGAGCYLFNFTTSLEGGIPCVDSNNQHIPAGSIPLGYYVQVAGSSDINGLQDNRAGIYLNPNMVRLIGTGEVIHVGPSAETLFGKGPAPTLPAGMGAPAMPQGMQPPQAPQQPVQPQMQPPAAPAMPQGMQAPQAPQQPVQPQMQPPAAPAMPQGMQAPQAPQQPVQPNQQAYQPHPGILVPGQSQ